MNQQPSSGGPLGLDVQAQLERRFGVTMSIEEVGGTLKMSVPALRTARSRQTLPLDPIPLNGRRHQIYWTADIARFLLECWASRDSEPEHEQRMDQTVG